MERTVGRPPSSRARAVILATGLAVVLVGLSAPQVRAAPPTLEIVSPGDGAVIGSGTPVPLVLATTDFNLTEPGAGGADPNAGHVQIYVDDTLFALTSDPAVMLPLSSGMHGIRVRLVRDDGSGLSPEVTDSVSVMVTRGPAGTMPDIEITHPANGAERGPDSTVAFRLSNFALVRPGGPAGVPNEGHVEVLLDGAPYQIVTAYEPVRFSDMHAGTHTVTLRLADNVGNPLDPEVSATVQFRVVAGGEFDVTIPLTLLNGVLAAAAIAALYYPIPRKKA